MCALGLVWKGEGGRGSFGFRGLDRRVLRTVSVVAVVSVRAHAIAARRLNEGIILKT